MNPLFTSSFLAIAVIAYLHAVGSDVAMAEFDHRTEQILETEMSHRFALVEPSSTT